MVLICRAAVNDATWLALSNLKQMKRPGLLPAFYFLRMAGSSPAMMMLGGLQFEARFGGDAGHDLISVS
jgi:hypothetical protein